MAEKYNITYYMGAGASAMGIPVVADFKMVPRALVEYLKMKIKEKNENGNSASATNLSSILELIEEFKSQFEIVSSMDTLALRFYQHEKNGQDFRQYKRYKLFLQIIFLFQHFFKIKISYDSEGNFKSSRIDSTGDPRYENLIRTIGEITNENNGYRKFLKVEMPKNFEFITWNYDVLFEMALITDSNFNFSRNSEIINLFTNASTDLSLYDGAKMLKINGTAFGQSISNTLFEKNTNKNLSNDDFFIRIMLDIIKFHWTDNPLIKFAWEEEKRDFLKTQLRDIASKTDIVIIIGYSLPYVNRETDRVFFENLKPMGSLDKLKVYIQGRDYSDSQRIKRIYEQCYFKNMQDIDLIPVESGDFFYVPAEHFEYKDDDNLKKYITMA